VLDRGDAGHPYSPWKEPGMKCGIAAQAAILLLGSAAAQAQTTATTNTSTSSGALAATMLAPGAIAGTTIIQGAGGAAAGAAAAASTGGWNQPQLVMNTGSAPSTSTFNDCGVAFSGGLWLLTMSVTSESEDCKAQRQAIFAATHLKSIPIAFESMCAIRTFREAVARTNEPQCAQTLAERAKNAPKVSEVPPAPMVVHVAFAPTPGMTAADCLNAAPADQRSACRGLR
jgi:hypothetical protein